jgi:hypothetical protein
MTPTALPFALVYTSCLKQCLNFGAEAFPKTVVSFARHGYPMMATASVKLNPHLGRNSILVLTVQLERQSTAHWLHGGDAGVDDILVIYPRHDHRL